MLFLVGTYVAGKFGNVHMALDDAMAFASIKDAITHADEIGNAYVAQIKSGCAPNVIYESETDD